MGVVLAIPSLRKNVSAIGSVQISQTGCSHVQLDLIEQFTMGALPVLLNHELIDGNVMSSSRQDCGKGPFKDRPVSDHSCQVKDIHPLGAKKL